MIQQPLLRPLCRVIARSPAPESTFSPSHKRHAHWVSHFPRNNKSVPLRQRFPNFEASSLLIDLDAEDCPLVRAVQELPGEPQRLASSQRVGEIDKRILEEIKEFERVSADREHRLVEMKNDVFNPYRISDFDLLAAVLLGSGSSAPNLESQPGDELRYNLHDVLQGNGIQESVHHAVPSITKYMLKRQQVTCKTTPNQQHRAWFKRAIESADSFHVLERLITNTMQTASGRALVIKRGAQVAHKCESFIREPSVPFENDKREDLAHNQHILSFINNIMINFQRHELEPPQNFRIVASLLASKTGIQLDHMTETGMLDIASQDDATIPADEQLEPEFESGDTLAERDGVPAGFPNRLTPTSAHRMNPKRRPILHGPVHPMMEPPLVQHRPEARAAYG